MATEDGDQTSTQRARRRRRRLAALPVLGLLAAGAVFAGLAAVSVVFGSHGGGAQVLAAAADRTLQQKSARFEGEMTMQVRVPGLSGSATGTPAAVHLSVHGDTVFPDRVHLVMTYSGSGFGASIPGGSGVSIEAITIGKDGYQRSSVPGAAHGWVKTSQGSLGSFGSVLDPSVTTQLLKTAEGSIADVGHETVDGASVEHYRFATHGLPGSANGSSSGNSGSASAHDLSRRFSDLSWTIDAEVGTSDQLVHRLQMTGGGSVGGGSFNMTCNFRLFDFGAAISISPPPSR